MEQKKTVLVLCGGKSPEHNISLLSARSVIDNINRDHFDVEIVGITKQGVWYHFGSEITFENEGNPTSVALPQGGEKVYISQQYEDHVLAGNDGSVLAKFSVVFPVLHGMFGEDGATQGLLRLAGIPYVGCDVLGSSVCMDKDVAKRLLRDSDIGVADFITLRKGYNEDVVYSEVVDKLGSELYIKPVNLGSSVGVSFVKNEQEYKEAVKTAFLYDNKVIVEEKIEGKEIECAVLGNESPRASVIGMIAPSESFYTFESKYVDKEDAKLSIPAPISETASEKARALAVDVFRLLECKGFSRVDMFLTKDEKLIVNEVNTIPGFTSISMYPKLWEYSGLAYTDLLTELINLAIDRNKEIKSLKV